MRSTKENDNKTKEGSIGRAILTVICLLLFGGAALFAFSARWMLYTWKNLTMDELVYHLKAPLQGTSPAILANYVTHALLPALLCLAVLVFLLFRFRTSGKHSYALAATVLFSCCVLFGTVFAVENKLHFISYMKTNGEESVFIENLYADPKTTTITFPEEKRNLIYIFLESMETTYSDLENGGAFETDIIEGLTQIAKEGEDFSGDEEILNGAFITPGATWTMGGMFAQTSGLPLLISVNANDMLTQEHFFYGAETIGDILEEEGYRNVLLIGSEAEFGGRGLYFKEHGNYEIRDYYYAIDRGWIDKDYMVWWGYEDEKLFSFAKETLEELASSDEPFNLTILTVDTHFEDGYICRLCEDKFNGNQYANVLACSSKQVSAFVDWIKEQDFYENTTVVLVGDHLTMDRDFFDDVDSIYVRKVYTSFINSAVSPASQEKRVYNTIDYFPTTLAALGAKIKGDRLGLGTNLFSSKKTLTEEYGQEFINAEFTKHSEFMTELADIQETDDPGDQEIEIYVRADITVTDDEEAKCLIVDISNISSNVSFTQQLEIRVHLESDPDNILRFPGTFESYEQNTVEINYAMAGFSPEDVAEIEVYAIAGAGKKIKIEQAE